MVTRKKPKASSKAVNRLVPPEDLSVSLESLRDFGKRNITTYAVAVNLDRSVPDLFDGLKPVQRRILWTLSQMGSGIQKAGEAVGAVLGKYHPHGDCLEGETLVYTLDGKFTPIREMIGRGKKWVLAYDEKTGNTVPALAHSWRIGQHTKKTYRIEFSDGSHVEATGNHPFMIRRQGWVKAKDLELGQEILAGALIKNGYLTLRSSTLQSGTVHALVSQSCNGDREADEVVHHRNENRWDNRPKNLSIIDRADHHAEHLDNAIVGLRNGNKTMKSKPYRKAIRKKNSALMSAYNSWIWLIKAIKIARSVFESGEPLTPETYNAARAAVYNGTTIECLEKHGVELSELPILVDTWKLPTEDSKGHTSFLKEKKEQNRREKDIRSPGTEEFHSEQQLSRFAKVVWRLARKFSLDTINWHDYEEERIALAKLGRGYGNVHKRNYPKAETLHYTFGSRSFQATLKDASPRHCLFITSIEIVEYADKQPMYDFTVDGYENMLIATKNGDDQATLVVAHNSSIYGAMVTMVHLPTPAVFGQGGWGSMTDGAAAYRYTNIMLTNYGRSFFDPDYINKEVTSFVPNYNDRYQEPVTLPAQLPNILLNGGEGIGVGITTHLPTFTPESIINVLERLLKRETLSPLDFAKTLKFAHKWGGSMVESKENKQQWLAMFKGSVANVQFESNIEVDRDHKTIVIDDWPPGTNLESFVAKIRAMPETQRCVNSKGTSTYTIECKPAYNYTQFDKYVEKVIAATRQRRSFKINVTRRTASTTDGVTSFKTDFLALSVPQLLVLWLQERIKLETRSLEYRIRRVNEEIDYSKTMIGACSHIDKIVKIIRSSSTPEEALVKALKIKLHQAKWICDLQLRKISKLDESQYKVKLKEQQALLKQLEVWLKRPKSKVLSDLARVREYIIKDRNFQIKEDTQELTVI